MSAITPTKEQSKWYHKGETAERQRVRGIVEQLGHYYHREGRGMLSPRDEAWNAALNAVLEALDTKV